MWPSLSSGGLKAREWVTPKSEDERCPTFPCFLSPAGLRDKHKGVTEAEATAVFLLVFVHTSCGGSRRPWHLFVDEGMALEPPCLRYPGLSWSRLENRQALKGPSHLVT